MLKNKNQDLKEFEFEKIGHSTDDSTSDAKKVNLIKWTNYASSIEEFKQKYKYVGFLDFLAESEGQGTTVKTNNLMIF